MAPRELWKAGRKLRLQGQPFQLLALLLSRPGEVVTKGRADRAPLGELSTVGAGAQSEHRRRKDPYRSRRPGRQPTFRPDTAFRCLPLHRTGRVRTREASTAPVPVPRWGVGVAVAAVIVLLIRWGISPPPEPPRTFTVQCEQDCSSPVVSPTADTSRSSQATAKGHCGFTILRKTSVANSAGRKERMVRFGLQRVDGSDLRPPTNSRRSVSTTAT